MKLTAEVTARSLSERKDSTEGSLTLTVAGDDNEGRTSGGFGLNGLTADDVAAFAPGTQVRITIEAV